MQCREIICRLNELAPEKLACGWDNPGLLAGRLDKEVKRIYLALDATDQVILEAAEVEADMLLTHHPLIFKPLKQINNGHFIGRRLLALIQEDIAYYAMHTNFDCAPGGMADIAADKLGLQQRAVLEEEGEEGGIAYGIGRIGVLEKAMTLRALAGLVKARFGLPGVTVYGDLESKQTIVRCAVSPGSGGSMIAHALTKGAQVLVTGDIGHHEGIDSVAQGMAVIDAGHYGLEYDFVDFMERALNEMFGASLEVIKEKKHLPSAVI